MLAKRFPSLLPPLSKSEALEVARIHSIAGFDISSILAGARPFRAPHHVITQAGLIGGGSSIIRPGEVSLAHHGVLFLDEFPEYKRGVLEAMRAPLEDGRVRVSRVKGSYIFPARFQLIAAMNPCPCGRLGSDGKGCKCSRSRVQSYLQKLSQPILDRIDLHIELHPVRLSELTQRGTHSDQDTITLITKTHRIQCDRGIRNARLSFEMISDSKTLPASSMSLLERSADRLNFSARSVIRILRVARTIADLEQSERIESEHVAEALQYRCLDRLNNYAALG